MSQIYQKHALLISPSGTRRCHRLPQHFFVGFNDSRHPFVPQMCSDQVNHAIDRVQRSPRTAKIVQPTPVPSNVALRLVFLQQRAWRCSACVPVSLETSHRPPCRHPTNTKHNRRQQPASKPGPDRPHPSADGSRSSSAHSKASARLARITYFL